MWADFAERMYVAKTSAAILILLTFLIVMNALAVVCVKSSNVVGREWYLMDLVVDPTTEKPEERAVQIEETVATYVDNPRMRAENVQVHYGDKHAIQNMTIDIGANEVVAFIGPSGCGKSTFLRCLNRMNDTIDICRVDGRIELDGKDIYDPSVDVVPLRARIKHGVSETQSFPQEHLRQRGLRASNPRTVRFQGGIG